jgi:hypothetical protein
MDIDIDIDIEAAVELAASEELGVLTTDDRAEPAEEAFAEVLEEDPQAVAVLKASAPRHTPTASRLILAELLFFRSSDLG